MFFTLPTVPVSDAKERTYFLSHRNILDFAQCQMPQESVTATTDSDGTWTSESEVWKTEQVSRKPEEENERKFAGKNMGFSPMPQDIPQPLIMFLAAYGDILSLSMIALTLTFTFVVMVMACCLCCRHLRRSRKYKLQHKHSLQLRSPNGTANSQI